MQKWEYLTAYHWFNDKTDRWQFFVNDKEYSDPQAAINGLGEAGWELVSTLTFIRTNMKGIPLAPRTETYCEKNYFKRPKTG